MNAGLLGFAAPLFQGIQHFRGIAAGLAPDFLQAQAVFVDGGQRVVVFGQPLQALLMTRLEETLVAVQQGPGATVEATGGFAGAGSLLLEHRLDHRAAVMGHHLETVLHQSAQGIQIHAGAGGGQHRFRRQLFHFGQAQHFEQADPGPAHIELEPAYRQLGGAGVGVVIVMQLFAANQNTPRQNVA